MKDKINLDDLDANSVLLKIVSDSHEHQKSELKFRKRKFYTIWTMVCLGALVYILMWYNIFNPSLASVDGDYVSLVRISGVIDSETAASAHLVTSGLAKAYKDEDSKGVVLLINSPGGSPVQSSHIYQAIIELGKKYDKKTVAVGVDMLASGAYYIASAADAIYVDQSTITGSIGVVSNTFGLEEAISRIGVHRRSFIAGEHKNRFDNYKTLDNDDEAKMQRVLSQMHESFISAVNLKRKEKLTEHNDVVFSGDFWTGKEAVDLGLADALGNGRVAMEKEFGVEHYRDYTPRATFRDFMRAVKSGADAMIKTSMTTSFDFL